MSRPIWNLHYLKHISAKTKFQTFQTGKDLEFFCFVIRLKCDLVAGGFPGLTSYWKKSVGSGLARMLMRGTQGSFVSSRTSNAYVYVRSWGAVGYYISLEYCVHSWVFWLYPCRRVTVRWSVQIIVGN